jgi:ATP phosphoribosyltransferase
LEFARPDRGLFVPVKNFPLDLLLVQAIDVPNIVTEERWQVQVGITGEDFVLEQSWPGKRMDLKFKKIIPGFKPSSLVLAVREDSTVQSLEELNGSILATKYPNLTRGFFKARNLVVETVALAGSLEIAPILNPELAGVVDVTQTGITLKQNQMRVLREILECSVMLIERSNIIGKEREILEVLKEKIKSELKQIEE